VPLFLCMNVFFILPLFIKVTYWHFYKFPCKDTKKNQTYQQLNHFF
jgi:hypothetical protein